MCFYSSKLLQLFSLGSLSLQENTILKLPNFETNGRITIKMLNEKFEKEIKSLKNTVKLLEKRLDILKRKLRF